MNSATPTARSGPSGSASTRSPVPSTPTTRSASSATYATCVPVGSGRGSMTGVRVASSRTSPVAASATNTLPDKAKAAIRTAASTALPTTPPPCSRLRSRRARSCADSSSCPPSSTDGSASRVSSPVSTSRRHRMCWRSSPEAERRNSTCRPSGETWKPRGVPRVNRWVLACSRRNELSLVTPAPYGHPRVPSGDGGHVVVEDAGPAAGPADAGRDLFRLGVAVDVAVGQLDRGA